MTSPLPPDEVFAEGDPGDDTARRLRYQSSYAAILCLQMVAESAQVAEVLCEHHEDILVKLSSGKFDGIQVKTQQQGGLPWKTTDAQMKSAIERFARLESEFATDFRRYTIASNHPFYRAKAATSFYHIIDETANSSTGTSVKRFAAAVACNAKTGIEVATSMLTKLHIDDDLPKLTRITSALREAIAQCALVYRSATYADLERAASSLADMAFRAASISDDVDLSVYIALAECPKKAFQKATIAAKRLTPEMVKQLLHDTVISPPTLVACEGIPFEGLPKDLSIVDKKLTAGGLSATTVIAAKDWRVSAEHLQREWAAKYGEQTALKRYHHIATIVQTECASAHEESKKTSEAFGACMLSKLRERLAERTRESAGNTFDCFEEHLLGHAMIRTQECKVWWSDKFDILRS